MLKSYEDCAYKPNIPFHIIFHIIIFFKRNFLYEINNKFRLWLLFMVFPWMYEQKTAKWHLRAISTQNWININNFVFVKYNFKMLLLYDTASNFFITKNDYNWFLIIIVYFFWTNQDFEYNWWSLYFKVMFSWVTLSSRRVLFQYSQKTSFWYCSPIIVHIV